MIKALAAAAAGKKQLHYIALLSGLLLIHLAQANEEAELTITNTNNDIQVQASTSLLSRSSGGSRDRLSLHKKSHRQQSLMDSHSSRSGLVNGLNLNVAAAADLELNNDQDEEAVDGERGLQKKKKKKKKNGSGSGNNKNRKPSNNKKKDNKEKLRNQDKNNKKKNDDDKHKVRKDAYYKASPEWCLCEDLHEPDDWDWAGPWNEYDDDDDWSNGRLLMSTEDEQGKVLHSTFSGDDANPKRHLKSDELAADYLKKEKEESDGSTSLTEVSAAKDFLPLDVDENTTEEEEEEAEEVEEEEEEEEEMTTLADKFVGSMVMDEINTVSLIMKRGRSKSSKSKSSKSKSSKSKSSDSKSKQWCSCKHRRLTKMPTWKPLMKPTQYPSHRPTPRPTPLPTPMPTPRPTPRPIPRPTPLPPQRLRQLPPQQARLPPQRLRLRQLQLPPQPQPQQQQARLKYLAMTWNLSLWSQTQTTSVAAKACNALLIGIVHRRNYWKGGNSGGPEWCYSWLCIFIN